MSPFTPFHSHPNSATAQFHVRALIPCFNRPADLDNLLADLAKVRRPPHLNFSVLVVDNASQPPLRPDPPPGFDFQLLRLPANTGGSGGFNAALADSLSQGRAANPHAFFWLLDSDARLEPDALIALIDALRQSPDAVVAGSALALPGSGPVFELGGFIDPATGEYTQPIPSSSPSPVEVQYVAACSMMVRRTAVERAGLMPDVFLNGDDVEWCLRLAARTGGRILAVPASIARHPHPDKMRTWDRYYAARNAFAAIDRAGLGPSTRFSKAIRETARATAQALVGRDDLARLHIRGLRDALAGRTTGAAPAGSLDFRPFRPLAELPRAIASARGNRLFIRPDLAGDAALMSALAAAGLNPGVRPAPRGVVGAAVRLLFGESGVGIVSARARPADWWAGPALVTVAPQGFAFCAAGRWRRLLSAATTLARGLPLAAGLGLWGPGAPPRIPAAPAPEWTRLGTRPGVPSGTDLAIVVLSFNRWTALDRTLSALRADPALRSARIIVADNASTDSSADMCAQTHPGVEVARLATNAGVAGFNRGAERAESDFILILDDDAVPAPGVLPAALALLRRRPDLGAVALHPRHPADRKSEWPFASGARDDWPVMGCANLVRREAWNAVGGYEEEFFLYRNDTDLAMKLAEAGWGVHFDPEWVAWHDSPAAAKKSMRWFELATRNWIWLCRRHGHGLSKIGAIVAGWGWAHKQAGLDVRAQWRVIRGAAAGVLRPPPPLPGGLHADGRALRRLMALRFGKAQPPSTNSASIERHSP